MQLILQNSLADTCPALVVWPPRSLTWIMLPVVVVVVVVVFSREPAGLENRRAYQHVAISDASMYQ